MAQQARPKVMGQREPWRAQLATWSKVVLRVVGCISCDCLKISLALSLYGLLLSKTFISGKRDISTPPPTYRLQALDRSIPITTPPNPLLVLKTQQERYTNKAYCIAPFFSCWLGNGTSLLLLLSMLDASLGTGTAL